MPKFIINIKEKTEETYILDPQIECIIVSSSMAESDISATVKSAMEASKIVLFAGEDALKLYSEYDADGIVADLTNSKNIKKDISILRKDLKDGVLGIISRNRRHEAMLISENEPEFIIFKVWQEGMQKTQELVEWYAEFFLIQQAIELSDDEVDFNNYKADMVILTPKQYKKLVAQK